MLFLFNNDLEGTINEGIHQHKVPSISTSHWNIFFGVVGNGICWYVTIQIIFLDIVLLSIFSLTIYYSYWITAILFEMIV